MYKTVVRSLLLITSSWILILAAGCDVLPRLSESVTTRDSGTIQKDSLTGKINLASYVTLVEKLDTETPENLLSLYSETDQRYRAHRKPVDQVSLALLLSAPNTPFTDTQKALQLLQAAQKSAATGDSGLDKIIRLSLVYVANRDRLERQLKRETSARRALEQQLKALKSVEESLESRQ